MCIVFLLLISVCVCVCIINYVFVYFKISAIKCQWFSGKIRRCHRRAPSSILGWRTYIFCSFYQPTNQYISTYIHTYFIHTTQQNLIICPSTDSYIPCLHKYTIHILLFATLHNIYLSMFVLLDQPSTPDNTLYIIVQTYVHTMIYMYSFIGTCQI